jgi:dTDP-4-amino-4,6-dideoxygalactose transaminase
VKLCYLDEENECRQSLARTYNTLLADTELSVPEVHLGATHVYHQYVVRLSQREALRTYLRQEAIGTLIHYPAPVHVQPAYRNRLPLVAPLPWTEKIVQQVLSLPMFPQLREDQVQRVGERIAHFHRQKAVKF